MNDKPMEYLTNPIKTKIVAEVTKQGQTTAKVLAEKIPSIPQATLYRYLKKMVTDGILKVSHERKVRNVTEKVYEIAFDLNADTEKMIEENDGEAYLGLFQQFSIGLLNEYSAYCAQDGIDILNDGSGFRISQFYATLDELKELSASIQKIIEPYTKLEHNTDRKTRLIATIITPPNTEI
jgi:DNA-binding Lrp family transcriptional regulator